jgi:hypothetical protein
MPERITPISLSDDPRRQHLDALLAEVAAQYPGPRWARQRADAESRVVSEFYANLDTDPPRFPGQADPEHRRT